MSNRHEIPSLIAVLLGFALCLAQPAVVAAQGLPSTTEFMNTLAVCGAGAGIKLEGDLRGSIASTYEREKTQGKIIQDIIARIIELMPPEQRLAAYNAYLGCVTNIIGRGGGGKGAGNAPDPSPFVGAWSVIDPRVADPRAQVVTTAELMASGAFRTGSWGRSFGGPNPLGANQWRFENGLLKFVYVAPGRPRVDEMLVGAVRDVSASEFQFNVVGGYYGPPNMRMSFVFKKP
jgi:hypothetical protein